MKALIIEDEYPAAERLQNYIKKIEPAMEVVTVLDSVQACLNYFMKYSLPDLIFSDIHLSDGLSFEVFEDLLIKRPVIFTTTYDESTIKAFKVNSIDYILKPIKKKDLETAIQKFKFLQKVQSGTENLLKMQSLSDGLQIAGRRPKRVFLLKIYEQLVIIDHKEIAYFMAHQMLVYLVRKDGKTFVVDYTLEQLEKMLCPELFFRANRKIITCADSVRAVHTYLNGRLKIKLQPQLYDEVSISKEKAGEFKQWLEGEFVGDDEL